ncbi:MAG: hypothetical protein DRQ97_13425 [Gammaproteobacteria bacterium]|nr:MAG: hypothetical protein DRQ97_13425 [Gammaproteobacteria bacterium]
MKDSWKNFDTIKVAAVQLDAYAEDRAEKMVEYINRAGGEGVDLIAFPEFILGAFYKDTNDVIEAVAQAADKNSVYVVAGGMDEYEEGAFQTLEKDAFANTALLFGRDGKIVGKYDKNHRATGDNPHCWPHKETDVEWRMKAGDGYPVFDLDFGRIGIMTCYDGYFAEGTEIMSLKGAELVVWINGRAGPIEPYIVQADTFRHYVAMVTTNFHTGSGLMVCTWPDEILAHSKETGDQYVSSEIDMKTLRWRRANSRTHHQRRPEIYQEIVGKHEPWLMYEGESELTEIQKTF